MNTVGWDKELLNKGYRTKEDLAASRKAVIDENKAYCRALFVKCIIVGFGVAGVGQIIYHLFGG